MVYLLILLRYWSRQVRFLLACMLNFMSNAVVTSCTIRLWFDVPLTAYRRSLSSQWCNPLAAVTLAYLFMSAAAQTHTPSHTRTQTHTPSHTDRHTQRHTHTQTHTLTHRQIHTHRQLGVWWWCRSSNAPWHGEIKVESWLEPLRKAAGFV